MEIKEWVTCPKMDALKRGPVKQTPICVPPSHERCKATARPPIVNAVDGGEALKCVKGTTGKRVFNVLGQPICDNPWEEQKRQEEDRALVLNTIGQLQRPYDLAKLVEEKATYNTIGQKVTDEVFRLPENRCEKLTLNILGQAVRVCDTVPVKAKIRPRCGPLEGIPPAESRQSKYILTRSVVFHQYLTPMYM